MPPRDTVRDLNPKLIRPDGSTADLVAAPAPEPKTRPRLPITLILAVVSLVAAVAGWFAWDAMSRRALQSRLAMIASAGLPTTSAELVGPPVTDGPNGAAIFLEAWARVTQFSATDAATGELLPRPASVLAWSGVLYRPSTWPEDQRRGMAQVLAHPDIQRALEDTETAARLPVCRFSVDYAAGPRADLAPLDALEGLVRLQVVAAGFAADAGDKEAAGRHLLVALWVANAAGAIPCSAALLRSWTCDRIAISAIQYLASTGALSSPMMIALGIELREHADQALLPRAIAGERLLLGPWAEHSLLEMRLDETDALTANEEPRKISRLMLPVYREMIVDFYADLQQHEQLANLPYESLRRSVPDLLVGGLEPTFPYHYLQMRQGAVPSLHGNMAVWQAQVAVCMTGLAVLVHRSVVGEWPVDLAAIDKAILSAPPIDPLTGRTLTCHLNEHGFLIYSLGRDGRDDGGTAEPGTGADDILWRAHD